MTKNKKNLILTTLLATTTVVAPIIAVSCGNDRKLQLNQTFVLQDPASDFHKVGKIFDKNVSYNVYDNFGDVVATKTTTLWDYFNAFEADVVSLSDGDTVKVRITKAPINAAMAIEFPVGKEVKIRIPLIDTLEASHASNNQAEAKLSDIDTAYIENLLKAPNNHVRVILDSVQNTYDRYVAYVFFGENFEKNWSTEMLGAGFTLARFEQTAFKFFKSSYNREIKDQISSYLFPFIAAAATSGIKTKQGFYNGKYGIKTPADLAKKYLTHGGDGLLSNTYTLIAPSLIPSNVLKALEGENVYQFIWKQMDEK